VILMATSIATFRCLKTNLPQVNRAVEVAMTKMSSGGDFPNLNIDFKSVTVAKSCVSSNCSFKERNAACKGEMGE
jgi:hypothetical protein